MTNCMKDGCEKEATYWKRRIGITYDSYKCEEHKSRTAIRIENAPDSIQKIHEEVKAEE